MSEIGTAFLSLEFKKEVDKNFSKNSSVNHRLVGWTFFCVIHPLYPQFFHSKS